MPNKRPPPPMVSRARRRRNWAATRIQQSFRNRRQFRRNNAQAYTETKKEPGLPTPALRTRS